MRLTDEKIKDINNTLKELPLFIESQYGRTIIRNDNGHPLCTIDALPNLIIELQTVKRKIEKETGIIL